MELIVKKIGLDTVVLLQAQNRDEQMQLIKTGKVGTKLSGEIEHDRQYAYWHIKLRTE